MAHAGAEIPHGAGRVQFGWKLDFDRPLGTAGHDVGVNPVSDQLTEDCPRLIRVGLIRKHIEDFLGRRDGRLGDLHHAGAGDVALDTFEAHCISFRCGYTDRMERSEAKALGLIRYTTGRPCKRGHATERNTSDGQCLDCSRQKIRDWQKANPEKKLANRRQWRRRYTEKVKASLRRQYERNPGKYKLSAKDYALRVRRAAVELGAEDRGEMLRIYQEVPDGMEVDHIVPLHGETVCGLHVPWNLQHLPMQDNRKKSNSFDPDDPVQGSLAPRRSTACR